MDNGGAFVDPRLAAATADTSGKGGLPSNVKVVKIRAEAALATAGVQVKSLAITILTFYIIRALPENLSFLLKLIKFCKKVKVLPTHTGGNQNIFYYNLFWGDIFKCSS